MKEVPARFVADDGTEFASAEQCEIYERLYNQASKFAQEYCGEGPRGVQAQRTRTIKAILAFEEWRTRPQLAQEQAA